MQHTNKLFVSLSVDDIGIRKHIDMAKNGELSGYPDLGEEAAFVDLGRGRTSTPSSHVMVLMLTAINDHFKVGGLLSVTNSVANIIFQ